MQQSTHQTLSSQEAALQSVQEQAIRQVPDTRKPTVAVLAWGLRHDIGVSDDPMIERVLNSVEEDGLQIEFVPGNLDPKLNAAHPGEVRGDRIAEYIKAKGIRKVVVFVARSNEALQELLGDLCVAGIGITLVGVEGYKQTPMPCTRRHFQDSKKKWKKQVYLITKSSRRDASFDKWDSGIRGPLAPLAGRWQLLAPNVHRWQEPRWSYDELANSTMPFGKVIMWSPQDYMQKLPNGKLIWCIETAEGKPLVPPDDVEYPHGLDLAGFKFCEVPARYIDYLVGQSWVYGEFSQRLRQWHAHPVIQEELSKFEDDTYQSGLKSDSTGYWNEKDQYIYTGCQGGQPIKERPVWLTPRDRFGKPTKERTKFGIQPRDRYAENLEKGLFHDAEDAAPENWEFTKPWAFEQFSDGRDDSHEDEIDEEDIAVDGVEGIDFTILEEEIDFQRRVTDPAKWIYNPDVHVERAINKAKEKAITRGQKARALGDPKAIAAAKAAYLAACKETKEQREAADKKAEAHAWYLAVELLGRLERLRERAGMKEPKELRGYTGRLFSELEDISLEITPLLAAYLRESRGDAKQSMLQLLREEYRQTKEALKELATRLQADRQTEQVASVLREHPELIYQAMKMDYGMLIWTLRENPDIGVPADLIQEARKFHKQQVRQFPEIWTKKGTRRKFPIHERATKKAAATPTPTT